MKICMTNLKMNILNRVIPYNIYSKNRVSHDKDVSYYNMVILGVSREVNADVGLFQAK